MGIMNMIYNMMRVGGKSNHLEKILESYTLLKKLEQIEHSGAVINYLRKIDSDLFEEVILSRLEKSNLSIRRNKKYTGDGGIDGWVKLPQFGWAPIQAKRYAGHIQAQHMRSFGDVIKEQKSKTGIFVHTGRTGSGAFNESNGILVMSGSGLASFINARVSFNDWFNNATARICPRSD